MTQIPAPAVGIDALAFAVPPYFLDMDDLAAARGADPAKFHLGLGQDQMAVGPVSQDIVTYAANAAAAILSEADRQLIDLVIVGTESSVDESKAAAVSVHRLLGIQPFARSFEIKEACYGATAGLALAADHVRAHPASKALVIGSDIARYGLRSSGEPTQGAGAVALLVTANPRILALADDNLALTQDVYDFWRPTGQAYPTVDGKFSNSVYIDSFARLWQAYSAQTGRSFGDFGALVFHTPYTKMGKKALTPLLDGQPTATRERLLTRYESAITYNRRVGNLYTGSLYLSLISLLENCADLTAGERVGLFSYGSGSVAEFFSGLLVPGFEAQLRAAAHTALLDGRSRLSLADYEAMYSQRLDLTEATGLDAANTSGHEPTFDDPLPFTIERVSGRRRFYRDPAANQPRP